MQTTNIRQLENKLITSSIKSKENKHFKKQSFEQVLNNIQNNNKRIKFSKHAVERMNLRNICLNNDELSRIENAVKKAEQKGVKDALIVMGDTAFITSIKNKTIITTINKEQLKDNVFTNIDGAVII